MTSPRRTERTAGVGRLRVVTAAAAAIAALSAACGAPPPSGSDPRDGVDATASPSSAAAGPPAAAPLPTGRPGKPAGPVPDPAAVDRTDAAAVAVAAAVWMGSADTAIDTSWYDASLRAAPFLTPQLLGVFAAARPRSGPGRAWLEWWEHRAYTAAEAVVSPDDQEAADTLLTVYRKVTVRLSPIGRDGWRGEPTTYFQFITLSRASVRDGWRVEAVIDDV